MFDHSKKPVIQSPNEHKPIPLNDHSQNPHQHTGVALTNSTKLSSYNTVEIHKQHLLRSYTNQT